MRGGGEGVETTSAVDILVVLSSGPGPKKRRLELPGQFFSGSRPRLQPRPTSAFVFLRSTRNSTARDATAIRPTTRQEGTTSSSAVARPAVCSTAREDGSESRRLTVC